MGIEVVLFLFALKLSQPKHVGMLRGNHESRNMTESFTFREEVLERFDLEVYELFMEAFDALPIAGLIAKKEPQPPKEKKKKGKSKRHLLTSMTYHLPRSKSGHDDIEEEEPPEDGEEPALGEIQEEEKSKDLSENESEPEEAEPSADEPDKDQEEEKQVPLEEGDEAAMHGASMTEIQNSMLRTA